MKIVTTLPLRERAKQCGKFSAIVQALIRSLNGSVGRRRVLAKCLMRIFAKIWRKCDEWVEREDKIPVHETVLHKELLHISLFDFTKFASFSRFGKGPKSKKT